MKVMDLMQKAISEKKDVYFRREHELYKVEVEYFEPLPNHATVYYQETYDEWKPAAFCTLWLVSDDYEELTFEQFMEYVYEQELF